MSEKLKQVVVDITISAPLETVWRALRDPDHIANWFGWDADTLPDEIKYIFIDNATGDEASHTLQFHEWEGSGIVEQVELTSVSGGTRLKLVRSGGTPIDWTGVYEDISQGWITFFEQLRWALERHPGEVRRTIYLSGPARPGIGEPSEALGLGPINSLAPRTPYATTLSTGDVVTGEVWFQTHFQTAVTVQEWGNGLLIVSDMGVSTNRPHGGGSVLITTYGLSGSAFEALDSRWTAWWSDRYPKQSA